MFDSWGKEEEDTDILPKQVGISRLEILVTEGKDSSTRLMLVESINELSIRMKETFKAKLPVFYNHFPLLKKDCTLFRDCLTGVMREVDANRTKLSTYINVCDAFMKCIRGVREELNDSAHLR